MKKRILAISDIHGHCDQLKDLLKSANYNHEEDQLVLLGDLVDRGQQNVKTIMYARELKKNGAIVLMGNHDKMALLSVEELINEGYGINCRHHVSCVNGYETVNEFEKCSEADKKIIRNFLKGLPLYYEHDKYIFVHSGVDANTELTVNSEDNLLWSRDEFYNHPAYEDKVVVFGHTPTKYLNGYPAIWFDHIHEDKIGIDCGCFFSGVLGCLKINLETKNKDDVYNTYYVRRD